MRQGISVTCALCGRTKKPIGRDAHPGSDYCEYWECEGYVIPPYPGQLWFGESEEEFGYLVGKDGTKEIEENGN